MASDEISVRLDEIVESLNDVLKVTERVPAEIFDVTVAGPGQGVPRDFRLALGRVVLTALEAAKLNKIHVQGIANAVSQSVKELEEADRISGAKADQYEDQLAVPVNNPGPGQQFSSTNPPGTTSSPAPDASPTERDRGAF